MTQLSLDSLFDFTIYALQVCSSFIPTYELHISFSCRKRKKGHNIFIAFGEAPQIPHILRDLRVSYNGSSEFYFENYKNSRIMVEQRTWDIVLDLIVLSFNCSRPKWRLKAPWLKVIWVSLKVRSMNFNPEENSCLNACVLLRSCINVFKNPNFLIHC